MSDNCYYCGRAKIEGIESDDICNGDCEEERRVRQYAALRFKPRPEEERPC